MAIKKLSPEIASKIAAGEVVERPLSVVKELIENSIDASATEISIQIQEAGRRLIEVTDNGSGIAAQEAELAVQRYATSKIFQFEDLEHINTLGFRGEALASMAAVSRLTLNSRAAQDAVGVQLIMEGGKIITAKPAGWSAGTQVKVEDLFYNIPARRKFLKSENSERRNISELVSRYALHYANIRFELQMESRRALVAFGNGERREVFAQVYDIETARSLLEVNVQDEYLRVKGFISPLNMTRSNRREIYFFINGRLISDAALSAAVSQAYQTLLMVGRYPIAALFLEIDPQEIDVNVHPTKAEVRFREPKRVFSLIHSAVRKSISATANIPHLSPTLWSKTYPGSKNPDTAWEFALETKITQGEEFLKAGIGGVGSTEETQSEKLSLNIPLLRLVGQIGRTYLVAEGPDGLYLIDQHAAHERILFEQFTQASGKIESQYLLEAAVVQIPGQTSNDLMEKIGNLNQIGFQIEEFGPFTYKISAVPAIIRHLDPKDALRSVFEEDEEENSLVESEQTKKLITRICKRAAIKGGQVLTTDEQTQLLRDLEQCENPRTCPHGRPTMIHLSVDVLERQFGRRGSL